MKNQKRIALLLCLSILGSLCVQLAFAQMGATGKTFEGTLEFKLQTSDRVQFFNYLVKRDRIRIESMEGDDTTPIIIIDHEFKKNFYILSHREQYAELEGVREPQDQQSSGVEKSGEIDRIEGFSCEQFLVKGENDEIEIWATKDLGAAGTFYILTNDPPANFVPWQNAILSQGYFPIRIITRDKEENEITRFELTSVQKKTLSESLFRLPADYEKIGIEQLHPKPAPKKGRTK